MVPPDAEPAPMMVVDLVNEQDGAVVLADGRQHAFQALSKSPRYLVPATSAPRSSE